MINEYEGLFPKNKRDVNSTDRFGQENLDEIDPKFEWYNLIFTFVKELSMKENEIYEMNYIHSLNWLSYFKNKNDVEKNKIEKRNKIRK